MDEAKAYAIPCEIASACAIFVNDKFARHHSCADSLCGQDCAACRIVVSRQMDADFSCMVVMLVASSILQECPLPWSGRAGIRSQTFFSHRTSASHPPEKNVLRQVQNQLSGTQWQSITSDIVMTSPKSDIFLDTFRAAICRPQFVATCLSVSALSEK